MAGQHGPVVDRTKERLCSSNMSLAHARWRPLDALAAFKRGETTPHGADARPKRDTAFRNGAVEVAPRPPAKAELRSPMPALVET